MKKLSYSLLSGVVIFMLGAHLLAAEKSTGSKITVRTDKKSIEAGKVLFNEKCYFCHDANSTKNIVGPGLKGILKNKTLPLSKKPATPENIASQLKNPYKDMPPFTYFSDEDVQNIIAYLNTL